VAGVREDTLPMHAALAERLRTLEPELPALFALADDAVSLATEPFGAAILGKSKAAALDAVETALRRGVTPDRLAAELALLAAVRLSRFDPAIDTDPRRAEGWLDITHVFTFAESVRVALARLRRPESLRWLFHAAAFIQRTHRLEVPPEERCEPPAAESATPEEIVAAVEAGDALRAVSLGKAWLAGCDGDVLSLREALEALPLRDLTVLPIVTAHVIKGVTAACNEAERAYPDPRFGLPVLAVLRWLASPMDERRSARRTHEARELVAHGRPPRRLVR